MRQSLGGPALCLSPPYTCDMRRGSGQSAKAGHRKASARILDYASWFTDREDNYCGQAQWSQPRVERRPSEPRLFQQRDDICAYCRRQIICVYRAVETDQHWNGERTRSCNVWLCSRCGWWHCVHGSLYEDRIGGWSTYTKEKALLKSFDASGLEVPLDVLNREARRNPDVLHQIHPTKLEHLMQQVLRDFFACDVKHCGRSHDGRIDLLVVDAERPLLVQVKRRISKSYIEPVKQIREFLGAMLVARSKRGLFVSTCARYSRDVERLRRELLSKQVVDYFETMDFSRIVEVLKLAKQDDQLPWREVFTPLEEVLIQEKRPFDLIARKDGLRTHDRK